MKSVIVSITDNYIKSDGTAAIKLRIFLDGKRVILSTGVSVEPTYFNKKRQRVNESHPQSDQLNAIIERQKALINEINIKYILKKKILTPHLLKEEFLNPNMDIDFLEWMKAEINRRKHELTDATISSYTSIRKKISEYHPKLTFAEINENLILDFKSFMKKKKNNSNTISKTLRVFKAFIRIALRKELIEKDPFEFIKIKTSQSNLIYLTEEELKSLIELYQRDIVLHKVRKVLRYFLFACLTGLRISDIKRLRWEDIEHNTIYIEPQKTKTTTGKRISIPLNKFAIDILQEIGKNKVFGFVFDVYSDQKTNQHLKDISAMVRINKPITFHVARHTFATLFYEKTKDIATLQQLLGHANIAQTMVYAHVSEGLKKEQMKKMDDLFML